MLSFQIYLWHVWIDLLCFLVYLLIPAHVLIAQAISSPLTSLIMSSLAKYLCSYNGCIFLLWCILPFYVGLPASTLPAVPQYMYAHHFCQIPQITSPGSKQYYLGQIFLKHILPNACQASTTSWQKWVNCLVKILRKILAHGLAYFSKSASQSHGLKFLPMQKNLTSNSINQKVADKDEALAGNSSE